MDNQTPIEFKPEMLKLNTQSPMAEYSERKGEVRRAIHWGQRKLLLSEIQFFTDFWDPAVIPNPVCVYAGSAPGYHIPILSAMFPAFTFHLWDPRPFGDIKSDKIMIHKGLFTEETAKEHAPNGDNIFLISDIRVSGYDSIAQEEYGKFGYALEDRRPYKLDGSALVGDEIKAIEAIVSARLEKSIFDDMELQKTFLFTINPAHALFKMRLPYPVDGQDKLVEYIKGEVYWQIWPRPSSAETRLKPTKNADGRYETAMWSILEYEQWCYYHNSVVRESASYYNIFTGVLENISYPELLNDFDSVGEAMILKRYFEKTGITDNKELKSLVIKMATYITEELMGPKIQTLDERRRKSNVPARDSFKPKTAKKTNVLPRTNVLPKTGVKGNVKGTAKSQAKAVSSIKSKLGK